MSYQKPIFNSNEAASFLNSSNLSQQNDQQIKYHELYREHSCLRNQLRGLKNQNEWLINTKIGLQQQNKILRESLHQKKQIILNLNQEIKIANKQIERVQDELQANILSSQNLQVINAQNMQKLSFLQNQNQKLKLQLQQKLKTYQQEKQNLQNNLIQVNKFIKKELTQLYSINFTNSLVSQEQKCNKQMVRQQTNYFNDIKSQIYKHQKLIGQMIGSQQKKCLCLQKQLNEQIKIKQNLIFQLAQATNLLDEQNQRHKVSYRQFQSLKSQIMMEKQQKEKCIKLLSQCKKNQKNYVVTLNILKQILPQQTIDLIESANKFTSHFQVTSHCENSSHFETKKDQSFEQSVYFQELQNLCQKLQQKQKRQMKILNDYFKNRSLNQQTIQELELTKLKLITLQRQYNEILEDNRRLINFNNLSKYRVQRNFEKQKIHVSQILANINGKNQQSFAKENNSYLGNNDFRQNQASIIKQTKGQNGNQQKTQRN